MAIEHRDGFDGIRKAVDARIAGLKAMIREERERLRRMSEALAYASCDCAAAGEISRCEMRSCSLPRDIRVPPVEPRPPNLNAACLSFAAHVVLAVRDRFGGDAPRVYAAAKITRQAYSQIVSDETHKISKRTAVRFAFALRLTPAEAGELLKSAGYAFSNSLTEDFILQACLENNPPVWNLDDVNMLLREYRVDFQY